MADNTETLTVSVSGALSLSGFISSFSGNITRENMDDIYHAAIMALNMGVIDKQAADAEIFKVYRNLPPLSKYDSERMQKIYQKQHEIAYTLLKTPKFSDFIKDWDSLPAENTEGLSTPPRKSLLPRFKKEIAPLLQSFFPVDVNIDYAENPAKEGWEYQPENKTINADISTNAFTASGHAFCDCLLHELWHAYQYQSGDFSSDYLNSAYFFYSSDFSDSAYSKNPLEMEAWAFEDFQYLFWKYKNKPEELLSLSSGYKDYIASGSGVISFLENYYKENIVFPNPAELKYKLTGDEEEGLKKTVAAEITYQEWLRRTNKAREIAYALLSNNDLRTLAAKWEENGADRASIASETIKISASVLKDFYPVATTFKIINDTEKPLISAVDANKKEVVFNLAPTTLEAPFVHLLGSIASAKDECYPTSRNLKTTIGEAAYGLIYTNFSQPENLKGLIEESRYNPRPFRKSIFTQAVLNRSLAKKT